MYAYPHQYSNKDKNNKEPKNEKMNEQYYYQGLMAWNASLYNYPELLIIVWEQKQIFSQTEREYGAMSIQTIRDTFIIIIIFFFWGGDVSKVSNNFYAF